MKDMINSLGVDGLKIEFILRQGLPSHIICEESKKINIDLIILGTSHKSAISKLFSGTTAAFVIENSEKPVLTIPEKR
jgi:nucleotide-binding universal stress UspA family protein